MNFRPLQLDFYAVHQRYWADTPTRCADTTFTNLWGWAECYGLTWREAHGLCWLRQTQRLGLPDNRLWAPLGNWSTANWDAILAETAAGCVWERVPQALCDLLTTRFADRVQMEETPGQWEYVYPAEALAALRGNKLHKKRNHVNGYIKTYGVDYRPLREEDMDAVLELQHDWCMWRECEKSLALQAENAVVVRVLSNWKALPGLVGGALYVDNRMVAFSVGETLDEAPGARSMVIHFEKGRAEFRGVYQAINALFAQNACAGYDLINREQDADEEGLRQAKESYFPSGFVVKNRLHFV